MRKFQNSVTLQLQEVIRQVSIRRNITYKETKLTIHLHQANVRLNLEYCLHNRIPYRNFSTVLVISSSKSLIYIRNSKIPNPVPCGAKLKLDFQFETSPFTLSSSHLSRKSIYYPSLPLFSLLTFLELQIRNVYL